MSDKDMARRTSAEVAFAGVDITESIQKFLTSITYTDNEEDETDDLQINLHDREDIWLTKWLVDALEAAASKAPAGPVTKAPNIPRPILRKGSRGAEVKEMQELLIKHGFPLPRFGADGGFGSETESAVSSFQSARGLLADGVCGPQTWGALLDTSSSGGKAAPDPGFLISVVFVRKNWNSDGKDLVLDCGQHELDAVSAKGPPSTIAIKGTSLPYGTGIRQTKKSKAWEACTLSGVASQIAASGYMVCMYESANNPHYDRLEQVETSDIEFLSMLCQDAGISLKVTNNIIVLFNQAAYESKPPVLDIKRGDGKYTRWGLNTGSTGTKYSSCRVRYTDPSAGRAIEGIAYSDDYKADAKNNQQLEVSAKVNSIGEAKTLAGKRLRQANKFGLTAQFTFPGNPNLVAGLTVTLTGWGAWSGKYIISQAQHTVSDSGYTTQIKLRQVLEGI